jgi:hypothetical protein
MFRSVSQMDPASPPDIEAGPGPAHETEEQEVGATVRDRSLEEMAADLRSLTDQVVTARQLGLIPAQGSSLPAVRQISELLAEDIVRTMERLAAEQRDAIALLMQHHAQDVESNQVSADPQQVLDRLDAIAARQQHLESLLRSRGQSLIPPWLAGVLALAALGISIGLVASLHFGIQP